MADITLDMFLDSLKEICTMLQEEHSPPLEEMRKHFPFVWDYDPVSGTLGVMRVIVSMLAKADPRVERLNSIFSQLLREQCIRAAPSTVFPNNPFKN